MQLQLSAVYACGGFISIFVQKQLGSTSIGLLCTGAPGAPCTVGLSGQALDEPRIHCPAVSDSAEGGGDLETCPGLIEGRDGEMVPGLAGPQG